MAHIVLHYANHDAQADVISVERSQQTNASDLINNSGQTLIPYKHRLEHCCSCTCCALLSMLVITY